MTLACAEPDCGAALAEALATPTFRPYWTDDLIGAEAGVAIKNVLAIACGVVEGRGLGRSAHAALVTRGFAELTRLAVALGGEARTVAGLCGLGDLVLTCSSPQSRNISLGLALGRGETLASLLADRLSVVEGVETAPAVRALAARRGVRLAVGFHGIPMCAPHTRPLGVTAHATTSGLTTGYPPLVDRLQVPGSVAALLEMRFGEEERAAVGFAVHVPHYLAQAAYPTAAITLLDSVARATGLQLPDEALREAAQETDEEIRRQVEGSEEIMEVVQALERQYDAFAEGAERGSLVDGSEQLPSADEIGAQFEQFLAEQQGRADSSDS